MRKLAKLTDEVSVGSAMAEEDFAQAAAAGYRSIINNRTDQDKNLLLTSADEAELARKYGLDYRHVPMASGTIPFDAARDFRAALEALPKPVLAHCGGATRSATLWSMAQAADGMDIGEILSITAEAGFDLSNLRAVLESLKT